MAQGQGYDGFNKLVSTNLGKYYEGTPQEMPGSQASKDAGDIKAGRPSLINRFYLFNYSGVDGQYNTPTNYIDDGRDYQSEIWRNPSFSQIITETSSGGRSDEYEHGDFLFCSMAGKIPNNHMITLRRFGRPVGDNIRNEEKFKIGPDIGRLVGYIDGEDNKWSSMMGFQVGYNWKELAATEQQEDKSAHAYGSLIPGKILRNFDTSGKTENQNLLGSTKINFDPVGSWPNRVWGPIDVITSMQQRAKGLNFSQTIAIKFEYELRSINNANPRVAMMDVLSNVLAVCYSRGEFWGGNIRFTGAGHPTPLGDPKLLEKGDFSGFAKSVGNGLADKINDLTGGDPTSIDGIVNAGKTILKNLASGLAGALLDKMGRPESVFMSQLISGDPTGEWHVTVGNPLNPAVVMGNMILKSTDISFDGPLGNNDFPSKLIVTVNLDHGRPRDKDDIESMFNGGNGRMYGSFVDFQSKTYYNNFPYPNSDNNKQNGPSVSEAAAILSKGEQGSEGKRFGSWKQGDVDQGGKRSVH